ncbi:MAG: hypothetical protein WCO07_01345 [bacterium]
MTLTPFTPKTTGMIPFAPGQLPKVGTQPAPEKRSTLQNVAGAFFDPLAKLSTEAGQELGVGLMKGADYLSGGKLGKLTPEGNLKDALKRSTSEPVTVPGLGTPVKPLKDVGVKDVAGQAMGVAGLATGNPMLGGALLMGGSSLEQGGTPADVVLNGIGGAITGKVLDLGFKAVAPEIEKALQKYGKPLYDKIVTHIPEGLKDTYRVMAEKASKINVGKTTTAPSTVDKFQTGAENLDKKITGVIKDIPKKLGLTAPEQTPDQKIAELIAPKPTAKEAKLAEMQGRLYKGKEQTLFKGETADKIATSDEQLKQVQTIKKLIPKAETMDEPTLYDTMRDKINGMAVRLKPQLEKVKIEPATVEKITNDWEALKKIQIAKADASEEANVKKLQTQFETLLKKSKSGNMNDLWETAKIYDRSIDSSVKRANDMSDSKLLYKKEIWLQNRKILKDAINDSKNGLGETSRQAFSDMTDMYGAQQGILTKAEVGTKLKGSKLSEFGNSTSGKLLKGAIGGAGVLETGKKAITGSW